MIFQSLHEFSPKNPNPRFRKPNLSSLYLDKNLTYYNSKIENYWIKATWLFLFGTNSIGTEERELFGAKVHGLQEMKVNNYKRYVF